VLILSINLSLGFKICAPKSAEEEYLGGLFMNQEKSDVTFKIEDQLIPAHKQVLMRKSRYFEGVFNSGMAESTQEVIEIKDCEYEIFKGKQKYENLILRILNRIFTIPLSKYS